MRGNNYIVKAARFSSGWPCRYELLGSAYLFIYFLLDKKRSYANMTKEASLLTTFPAADTVIKHTERGRGRETEKKKMGKEVHCEKTLKVLGSIRERPGRLGNIKSMHCNVNWLLTLIICLGSALALSAVTLAGLSKYGMGWNGERWGGRDRLEWEWEKKMGYGMRGYHQGLMGTLKFHVCLVNGIL